MHKPLKALGASTLFLALLVGIYVLHVRYLTVDVVFYAALGDGVIASAISATALFKHRYFRLFTPFEKAQMCAIWLLLSYTLAISVPTVIDRSLSFYILEKLQQRGGAILLDRFPEVFTEEYLPEHHLIQVRLTEQQSSGTIVIDGACVRLTERGKELARFSRYFRAHFLPRQRLLMGEYSDALTDPFRHSRPSPGYECP